MIWLLVIYGLSTGPLADALNVYPDQEQCVVIAKEIEKKIKWDKSIVYAGVACVPAKIQETPT